MNITFMIGNGFDLNCGMSTSYKDFYDKYTQLNNDESTTIQDMKRNIYTNKDTWCDFEVAFNEYASNFETEKNFMKCLFDFKGCFCDYLKRENRLFSNLLRNPRIYDNAATEFRKSVYGFYNNLEHRNPDIVRRMNNKGNKYNAISFNYTTALDILSDGDYYEKIKNNEVEKIPIIKKRFWVNEFAPPAKYESVFDSIVHIHGDLKNNNIVLGIDNNNQWKNTHFKMSNDARLAFDKTYFNTNYMVADKEKAEYIIDKSDIICVYGLSLGDTDIYWREMLIKWLEQSLAHILVCYFFGNVKIKSQLYDQKIINENIARRKLQKEWGIKREQEKVFESQVFLPCGINIFNIEESIIEHFYDVDKLFWPDVTKGMGDIPNKYTTRLNSLVKGL